MARLSARIVGAVGAHEPELSAEERTMASLMKAGVHHRGARPCAGIPQHARTVGYEIPRSAACHPPLALGGLGPAGGGAWHWLCRDVGGRHDARTGCIMTCESCRRDEPDKPAIWTAISCHPPPRRTSAPETPGRILDRSPLPLETPQRGVSSFRFGARNPRKIGAFGGASFQRLAQRRACGSSLGPESQAQNRRGWVEMSMLRAVHRGIPGIVRITPTRVSGQVENTVLS